MAPPADLRRTVLDASLALIEQEGLGALSMREVARRAGVSHQAPYHHFGDREGILAALVQEGFEFLRRDMAGAVAGLDDPFDRLEAAGIAYVEFALSHRGHFKLMFRSEHVAIERHTAAHARAETAFDLLVALIKDVANALGRKDVEALVMAAWSLAHGYASLALEGKLDEKVCAAETSRAANARRVMATFSELLRRA